MPSLLLGHQRHPVEGVVGEERVPLLVALGVEQARLVDDEVDQVASCGSLSAMRHIVAVM